MTFRLMMGDCREVLPYELTSARPGGRNEATRVRPEC